MEDVVILLFLIMKIIFLRSFFFSKKHLKIAFQIIFALKSTILKAFQLAGFFF
jgi:hypothetical protein